MEITYIYIYMFECCLILLCRYLRLELLEGIVAYHNGQFEQSRVSLTSAEDRYSKVR